MQTPDPHERPSPWPSALQGSIATILLALASMGSQFDRTVINLMVGPLKAAFDLDDTHFGMLQGVAFGIFYVVACVPIGRLADRFQRRLIIATGIGLFSLFAMASGLARSYLQLFLTRIGVAVGEASLTPAGLSMLSDLYSPDRLSRPISAFLMSAPVGQGLAFMAGGSLLHWLTTSTALTLGPLASLAPWQSAFIIVGAPVLLLVPLFLLQREPARRGPGGQLPLTVAEVVAVLRSRARAIVPMFAGFAMVNLVSYTLFIWTPAFMQRSYGWNTAQIGIAFGLIILLCGTGGVFFAGWLKRPADPRRPTRRPAAGGRLRLRRLRVVRRVSAAHAHGRGGPGAARAGDLPEHDALSVRRNGHPADHPEPGAGPGDGTVRDDDDPRRPGRRAPPGCGPDDGSCLSRSGRDPLLAQHRGGRCGAAHVRAAAERLRALPGIARGRLSRAPGCAIQNRSVIGVRTKPSG